MDTTVNKYTGWGVGSKFVGAHPQAVLVEADRPKTIEKPAKDEDKIAPGQVFVEQTNKKYFMYGAIFLIVAYVLMK